ncbi:MAG: hypothetical protein N5P05_003854 [Chroococcopsis gigantea SAG 12.99]|jgi:glycosyltransferase involved in cell wall biosynthesis|nr:glycosyltransferase [Chlorogloea purpurea SAG 13.99]MDV3002248.1 hypothetical protein [Chroococcopsis gigantea SAG 12.99]
MNIIIAIEFYRKGGVERTIISLIPYLLNYVNKLVIVLPAQETDYFRSLLPQSDKLIYETFALTPKSSESKLFNSLFIVTKLFSKLKQPKFYATIYYRIERARISARLNQLTRQYRATHCLYPIINRLQPPKINIPLSGISHDLFWHFAPLVYSQSFIDSYDISLRSWLEKADIVFTVSQKTKEDILKIFPSAKYQEKLKPVPWAGLMEQNEYRVIAERVNPIFYFPSSFGIYKDHLTVIKATIKLVKKDIKKFKIVFIGKETDSLVDGKLRLTQQLSTKEYQDYLQECCEVYENNKEIISTHIEGLGYCDYERVEHYYRTCSCVLMPSQYEGFGLAVSEALMWGIPVIASELDVYKEQVQLYQSEDRIVFYTPGNADELAQCMENFLNNPMPRLSGEEAREKMALWTWDDVARKYVSVLQQTSENAG